MSLYPEHVVLSCSTPTGPIELAMSPASLMGFQSWLESGPPGTDWDRAVRVALGLDHLRLVAAADTADGARLRFAVPHRRGVQIAFVAFGPDAELDRPRSAFRLRSIRWRDEARSNQPPAAPGSSRSTDQ